MNNREIVDYILSNKLTINDVIKETIEYLNTNEKSIMYIYNNTVDLWDDNGKVTIMRFRDDKPSLNKTFNYKYTYEIISLDQASKELSQSEKEKRIEELESELRRLYEEE